METIKINRHGSEITYISKESNNMKYTTVYTAIYIKQIKKDNRHKLFTSINYQDNIVSQDADLKMI